MKGFNTCIIPWICLFRITALNGCGYTFVFFFVGKPCEGEPHARFEVAGDGNGNYRAIA